ncbi:MAG: sulfatase-like hydrolase/transferase [Rhodospirillales bacterium]
MVKNVLFIMADEHQQRAAGCYGHPFLKTPSIDALAASGTRFTNAYTNSPICVPARARFATGLQVHETGYWDNAQAYDGRFESWGHALQKAGMYCLSIGKLHYRNETDPTGFNEQIDPMHITEGVGSINNCIKNPLPPPIKRSKMAENIGPGESSYSRYDERTTKNTIDWLENEAPKHKDQPWALFCSFVCPHYPLISPPAFYEMYPHDLIEKPKGSDKDYPLHPWIEKFRAMQCHDEFFTEETRKVAIASYYGLCSYLDSNIKKVLDTLEACGLRDDTLIIYTADHGENLATRRLWGKANMYEEAANIPLILSGPGVPAGQVIDTPVTLAEGGNTILDALGIGDHGNPVNQSWIKTANEPNDMNRVAFSQYHAAGADSAAFMIRKGTHKLIYYVNYEPELFDHEADPEEINNVAGDPAYTGVMKDLNAELRKFVNPEKVNAEAQASQAALLAKHGGREAVLSKGSTQGTPPPGEKIEYVEGG